VSEARIIVLGLIAGGSIFLGLPIGRMKRPAPQLRQFLNALAIGILIFLLWDVLAHAYDPITMALSQLHHHSGSLTTLIGYTLLFFGGLGVGLLSLTYYDKFLKRQKPRRAPRSACPPLSASGYSSPWGSGCTTSPKAWPSARARR
jgi:ZIP family zinc transporter